MLFGTLAHALATRRLTRLPGLFDYFKSEWLGGEDDKASPLVYRVGQPPNSTLPSHFHRQNEFQVFVDGDRTMGQRQIQPVTVHYAGAYTGYGPIVAGPAGLSYLTIRAVFDSGAFMVDSQRERMIRGPKRQLHADPFQLQSVGELSRLSTPDRLRCQ